jgi:hypothetical protein
VCKRLIRLIVAYDMVHWYVRYNSHGLTIWVNFMVCVCVGGGGGGGFGSIGFMIKMQSFPIDCHYTTDVISDVGHPRSDSVVPLVLCMVCYVMAGAPVLYYRFLGTVSTLLRMGNISSRPYC